MRGGGSFGILDGVPEGKEPACSLNSRGMFPDVEKAAFIAPNAAICGDVAMDEGSSVWFSAVIRGEVAPIRIGKNSNVQDNAMLHSDYDCPVTLGDRVSVGHNAIVHGATIEDDVTVGMHATVMNGAVIGAGSMVAAGALVKERSVIPPCSLVVGVPGKVIRTLDAQTVARNIEHSQEAYIADAQEYAPRPHGGVGNNRGWRWDSMPCRTQRIPSMPTPT